MQDKAVQDRKGQYSTIQDKTVQYRKVQCRTLCLVEGGQSGQTAPGEAAVVMKMLGAFRGGGGGGSK